MRDAEVFAYGEIGLLPWEFYRLTPREYRLKLQAHERAQHRLWLMVGTLGMLIAGPHWNRKKHGRLTMKHAIGFFPNPFKYLKRP